MNPTEIAAELAKATGLPLASGHNNAEAIVRFVTENLTVYALDVYGDGPPVQGAFSSLEAAMAAEARYRWQREEWADGPVAWRAVNPMSASESPTIIGYCLDVVPS